MPLPHMLQIITARMATIATRGLAPQLSMAEEDRIRPMAMMMGPVTMGGKKRITRLTPTLFIMAASITYSRPDTATAKQA